MNTLTWQTVLCIIFIFAVVVAVAYCEGEKKPKRQSSQMTDRAFLIWLHQRLVNVHKESPYVDYMHFLRDVIAGMPKETRSRSNVVTMTSMKILDEIRTMENAQ